MHYNCLIVDDEEELARMTAEYFNMFDVSTACVTGAEACFQFLREHTADLVLLDINLGDGTGFDVCKRLRSETQLPILFISARQSDDDVLVALSIGGDDYVKKPYSLSVLLAKVKVNLKRMEQLKSAGASVPSGPAAECGTSSGGFPALTLDESTMSAVMNGQRVALKAKEFALLQCLYRHRNTIVKKDVLFNEVWGDAFFSDGTLNVHIRKLREKLEQDPNHPRMLKTIWGTGYMLEL